MWDIKVSARPAAVATGLCTTGTEGTECYSGLDGAGGNWDVLEDMPRLFTAAVTMGCWITVCCAI